MSPEQDAPPTKPLDVIADEARRARLVISPIVAAIVAACTLAIVCSSAPSASERMWATYIGTAATICCLAYGLVDLYLYRRQHTAAEQEPPQQVQPRTTGEEFIDLMIRQNGFV